MLGFRGYYAAALHIAAAALLGVISIWLLKAGLSVDRPEQVLGAPISGAYPSAHAAGATILVTMAASFMAGESRKKQRWQTYVMLSLPLVPIALSRLYLGANWFTDIVGGLLLGLAITGAIRASYSRYDRVPIWPDFLTWFAVVLWPALTLGYVAMQWPVAGIAYTALP